jgi:hypothetical protein
VLIGLGFWGFRALWFFGVGWAISANVPRVYEPVARAQRLRFPATAVTEREGWAMGQTRDGTAVAPLPSATDVTKRGWTEPQATTEGRSAA